MKKSRRSMRQIRQRKKIIIGNIIGLAIIGVVVATVFGGTSIYNKFFGKSKSVASAEGDKKTVSVPKKPNLTDIVKGENVTYEGKKYTVPAKEVVSIVNNTYTGKGKRVFLTFDDGPSPNTEKVLNVLDKEKVKATFFVVGQGLENDKSKETLTKTIKSGHAIGNHSYTHNLKKLYPHRTTNIEYFMEEFNKTNKLMKEILGEEFDSKVLRMPGGYMSRKFYKDSSLPALDKRFESEGIESIDWNALNGDAEGKHYSTSQMLNNVVKSTGDQQNVVILMHDTYGKKKTAEMLPEVIKFYKNSGYEFKTIGN